MGSEYKTIIMYGTHGLTFTPQGLITVDQKEGISLHIRSSGRKNAGVIDCLLVKKQDVFALEAVSFNEDEGHGPYCIFEIQTLSTHIVYCLPELQPIFKAIYESYVNE